MVVILVAQLELPVAEKVMIVVKQGMLAVRVVKRVVNMVIQVVKDLMLVAEPILSFYRH